MEQLTKLIGVRLTEAEYALLRDQAEKQDRTIAWVAREKIREGMTTN